MNESWEGVVGFIEVIFCSMMVFNGMVVVGGNYLDFGNVCVVYCVSGTWSKFIIVFGSNFLNEFWSVNDQLWVLGEGMVGGGIFINFNVIVDESISYC